MIGDSLTESGPWEEEFGYINLGVGGYRTAHLIEDEYIERIFDLEPDTVFVMAGINDAMNQVPIEEASSNYSLLIDTLERMGIQVIVQSTLYQEHLKNSVFVEELNRRMADVCDVRKAVFLDLNESLSSNGRLRNGFSTDGTHLEPMAYQLWADELKSYLGLKGK